MAFHCWADPKYGSGYIASKLFLPRTDMSFLFTVTALMLLTVPAVSIVIWSLLMGITPTPSSQPIKKNLKKILPEHITGSIHELGCGWGHLLPLLAKTYPESIIIGYERSYFPFLISKLCTYLLKHQRLTIHQKSFYKSDYSKAGLIVCYLFPTAMKHIVKKIYPELPVGCWLITHTFRLPDISPVTTLYCHDIYHTPIYVYQKQISLQVQRKPQKELPDGRG
ncbi:hypothetical protein CI610_00507 [invertebrate metagenome]|uniref:Methyltransferase small domain-containing protein n=1 Tax=invertebrate metagenome TaxID=1711999 RepID=A0A2H9TB60_9ZZZZ